MGCASSSCKTLTMKSGARGIEHPWKDGTRHYVAGGPKVPVPMPAPTDVVATCWLLFPGTFPQRYHGSKGAERLDRTSMRKECASVASSNSLLTRPVTKARRLAQWNRSGTEELPHDSRPRRLPWAGERLHRASILTIRGFTRGSPRLRHVLLTQAR